MAAYPRLPRAAAPTEAGAEAAACVPGLSDLLEEVLATASNCPHACLGLWLVPHGSPLPVALGMGTQELHFLGGAHASLAQWLPHLSPGGQLAGVLPSFNPPGTQVRALVFCGLSSAGWSSAQSE